MADFISQMQETLVNGPDNRSVTENGAVGYKTTGKKLLDLNFMLSSLRNMPDDEVWKRFLGAYNETPEFAVLWLFFSRDPRGGCGERRTFRIIFQRLCAENPELGVKLLKFLPEYGRWDDLIEVFCGKAPYKVCEEAFRIIEKQLMEDCDNARAHKQVSLLAKWMPSNVTSSRETRAKAEKLRLAINMTPKQYRKTLSRLRKYLDVTEQRMSAGEWDQIKYGAVPSRAAMNYRFAFERHDTDRYHQYLEDVKSGKAKINAGVLFPHDIVHAYTGGRTWGDILYNKTLEAQWDALPNTVPDGQSTLVVVDGSGSMSCRIGNTGITCHDVANALGIYFSEKLKGPYANTCITFSADPHVIRFRPELTLKAKLEIMQDECDCSNTDIEKTFDLILNTAVSNRLSQDEMPANVLIISDMEFDAVTEGYNYRTRRYEKIVNATLFDTLRWRFEDAGYKLPRLVFWNVCSRTETIPVRENELGVALVSGFSPSIADMVMSCELDPWKVLVKKLTSERYEPILREMRPDDEH